MSMTCATPFRAKPPRPPVPEAAMPRFGIGRLETYDTSIRDNKLNFDIVMGSELAVVEPNATFSLPNTGDNIYSYFMSPVEYGTVSFKANGGFTGGWDGASWPLDDMGDEYGPVTITYEGAEWYMYRTDWPGAAATTYTVNFSNV